MVANIIKPLILIIRYYITKIYFYAKFQVPMSKIQTSQLWDLIETCHFRKDLKPIVLHHNDDNNNNNNKLKFLSFGTL